MTTFCGTLCSLRGVPHASIGHQHERAVVGAQEQAHVLLRGSVGSHQKQVRAPRRQHVASQPIAGEGSAGNREHATGACGRISQLTAMMQDHIAHLLVPALVQRLHAEAPGVRLEVLPWQSPASAKPEQLEAIDMLISCTAMDIAGFEKETLFTDTEAIVVRNGYPQASRLKALEVFLRSRHVAIVGAGLSEDPVDSWLREKGLSRAIVLQVPSYLQALQVAARADVVAFVPRRLARSMARRFSLRVLPPPIEPGDYQEQLFYPRRAAQDPASRWIRALAQRISGDLDRAKPA